MYSAHTYRVWWHQQKVNLTHNLMYMLYMLYPMTDDKIVLHFTIILYRNHMMYVYIWYVACY